MSTSCTIKIEGVAFAKIYKHWDGNPDSTLPWLEAFNIDFATNRGVDSEYKFAQLLRSSTRDANIFSLDDSKHTGWGVLPYTASVDIDYEYLLFDNGKVTYKEINK